MATLYELNAEMKQVQAWLAEDMENPDFKPEDAQVYLDTMDCTREEIAAKLEGYCMVIGNMENESACDDTTIAMLKERIEAIEKRKATRDKVIDKMKGSVRETLKDHFPTFRNKKDKATGEKIQVFDGYKLATPLFTMSVVKNPDRVDIKNDGLIPKRFFKQVVTEKLDKKEFNAWFKEQVAAKEEALAEVEAMKEAGELDIPEELQRVAYQDLSFAEITRSERLAIK